MAPHSSILLPEKSHGRRSLVGCSPWGRWESDKTERLHFHFSLSCIGEGNGNPLQCSCLENPRDGGTWWVAIYRVAQSPTWLKWLRSSSMRSGQSAYDSLRVLTGKCSSRKTGPPQDSKNSAAEKVAYKWQTGTLSWTTGARISPREIWVCLLNNGSQRRRWMGSPPGNSWPGNWLWRYLIGVLVRFCIMMGPVTDPSASSCQWDLPGESGDESECHK